jgi:hypothetical protein
VTVMALTGSPSGRDCAGCSDRHQDSIKAAKWQ